MDDKLLDAPGAKPDEATLPDVAVSRIAFNPVHGSAAKIVGFHATFGIGAVHTFPRKLAAVWDEPRRNSAAGGKDTRARG